VSQTAEALGQRERGASLLAEMDAQLASDDRASAAERAALYLTPAGATTGSGTLIDEVLSEAGLANAAPGSGWRSLPLEVIAQQSPDLLVTAYFDDESAPPDGWAAARHPVFQRLLDNGERLRLDGAQISCGTWMLADAVAELREATAEVEAP
jgi:iron complex transport system substrate-binding protein